MGLKLDIFEATSRQTTLNHHHNHNYFLLGLYIFFLTLPLPFQFPQRKLSTNMWMSIENQQYGGGRAQLELHVQIEAEHKQLWSHLVREAMRLCRWHFGGFMLSIWWHC